DRKSVVEGKSVDLGGRRSITNNATKEIQYLNAKGALTYTDIAGDPVLYGNLPPREISMKDVFGSGDSSKKFKIAECQWYRYTPSYVSRAYHRPEGFPFIQEPPSGDLQERVLIRHHDYDLFFPSRKRHTRLQGDWSSDVCSSDLTSVTRTRSRASTTAAACRARGSPAGGVTSRRRVF